MRLTKEEVDKIVSERYTYQVFMTRINFILFRTADPIMNYIDRKAGQW